VAGDASIQTGASRPREWDQFGLGNVALTLAASWIVIAWDS